MSEESVVPTRLVETQDANQQLHQEFSRNLKEISYQSFIFFAGTIFTMAAGSIVKVYVAHMLGAGLLGIYALGMTVVTFLQTFALLGLPGAAVRFVALYQATGRNGDLRAFLSRSLGLLLILLTFLGLVMVVGGSWISLHLYHAPTLGQYMPLFAALMWLGGFSFFYSQVLAGFKDVTKRTVITNFIGSPLVIVLTVILLALHTSLWGYLGAQIASATLILVLLAWTAWKLTPLAARFRRSTLAPLDREVVSFSAVSLGMSVLDFGVGQIDKILLGFYLNPRLVGIYVLASTLVGFVAIILQSVSQIFAPVIADLHGKGQRDVLLKLFQTLTKWTLGLTAPLALVIMMFARPLMGIFGAEFAPGWLVLVIGTCGQVVSCAVGCVGYLLLMSGNQKRMIKIQAVMTIAAITGNLILIPSLGIVGAALTASAINAAYNLWALYEVRKVLQLSPYDRSYAAFLLPVSLVGGVLATLHAFTTSVARQWVVILMALVLGYAVFIVASMIFIMDAEDRLAARDLWSRLRGLFPA